MRADVKIVAKTRMSQWFCVGGLLSDGRSVRLLNESGFNQSLDSPFEVGHVYEIDFMNKTNVIPPHVEDILVLRATYRGTYSHFQLILSSLLLSKPPFWDGYPDILFDGHIRWTQAGSGYVARQSIPETSTGFWRTDKPLTKSEFNGKVKYSYPRIISTAHGFAGTNSPGWRILPFVGMQEAVETVPAGTLCRVSLARWWKPDDSDLDERCYLQLSGWYLPDTT